MKSRLYKSVLLSFLVSGASYAQTEVTGKIIHESAKFTSSGVSIGNSSSYGNDISHGKDNFKSETSARVFIDGNIDQVIDGATYHVELQAYNNNKAISSFDDNESYTQRDALREAYIDTNYNDWLIRAGKQQAVWGTADGIKLLDAINPTDYSEFAQNSIEDSRIPVWMINADREINDGGNFQVIISQPKANFIPGMSNSSSTAAVVHNNGDKGHPFLMKGVDSITGRVNGFLNIAPDIGGTAAVFNGGFGTLSSFTKSTVGEFFGSATVAAFTGGGVFGQGANCSGDNNAATADATSAACMAAFTAQAHSNAGTTTNVLNSTAIDNTKTATNEGGTNPDSAFAYMTDATFATFDAFSGAKSRYVVDHDEDKPNLNLRYKNTTSDGTNYSVNLMRRTDSNPYVAVRWEDSSGNELTQTVTSATGAGNGALNGQGDVNGKKYRTITLSDATYGWQNDGSNGGLGQQGSSATLAFHEKLNEVTSIGGSFDTTIDSPTLGPIVIRGEGLFTIDEMMPVVDRNKLGYGDLPGGLTMQKSDTFKYVLGADVTALTNMMVSAQFIQMINLDYVDNKVDADGNACGAKLNCGVYSADMSAMHLSNGLQKAEEYKEFYSLYLSKPFGESGQHRWNNIYMYEENDGNWNRLDVEYTVDDNTQLTAEFNKYWGNQNTQFGQMKNSSNVQLGIKYSF